MSFWTPHIDSENLLERGRFLLAWRLSFVTSVLLILLMINFTESFLHFIIYIVSFIISFGSLIFLHITKDSRYVYIFSSVLGTLVVSFNMIYLTELYQVANVLWKIYIVSFTFFGLGKKWGLGILLLNIASMVYYSMFVVNTNLATVTELACNQKISLAVELSITSFLVAYIFYEFVTINNKSFLQLSQANAELRKRNHTIENQNEEKTTLVKEIHHRVKNNLQIIISLLRLQKSELSSTEAKDQFSQAINRIMVMSLIHEKLYRDKELAKVKIKNYLSDLSEDIKSLSDVGFKTKISIHSEIEKIGLKTIVPLGLLINELVSNSIKHAFENTESCLIKINISKKDDSSNEFKLVYADNGSWKEPEENASSFGVELISILTEQMDGEFERESDENGTVYSFSLVNIDVEK